MTCDHHRSHANTVSRVDVQRTPLAPRGPREVVADALRSDAQRDRYDVGAAEVLHRAWVAATPAERRAISREVARLTDETAYLLSSELPGAWWPPARVGLMHDLIECVSHLPTADVDVAQLAALAYTPQAEGLMTCDQMNVSLRSCILRALTAIERRRTHSDPRPSDWIGVDA